jgi:hypothetical protein
VTEAAGGETNPATWAPRLAMEQYLRYRLHRADQTPTGCYAQLRPFVEWCERVGLNSVGLIRSVDLEQYYDQRHRELDVDRRDREMRTLEQFCSFLVAIGASSEDHLGERVPGRQNPSTGSIPGDAIKRGKDSNVSTRRDTRCGPLESVGGRDGTEPRAGHFEYDIRPEESVTTAVVRVASAVDGRSPQFMPPLRNVLDPRALDTIFAATPEGTVRTGGQLSFVYGSCQVVLESDEYLTLQPLDLVQRGEPSNPLGPPHSGGEGQRGTRRSRRDPIRRADPDDPEDE